MKKTGFRLRKRKTGEFVEYEDGYREYTEVVDMKCTHCGYEESTEADMVFECWEFSDDPFPICECVKCGHMAMIPKQVIEETEAPEEKKKHLSKPKRK